MKKVPITSFEYLFDQDEIKVLKECLDYCYHRASKHPGSGVLAVLTAIQIQKLKDRVTTALKS